jgi:hypothetical protein
VSTRFVNDLRARSSTLVMSPEGEDTITIRVQMPEVWDAVRITASPTEPVLAVKVRAMEALDPAASMHEDLVLKLRGWEILDEGATLEDAGLLDGSTLLLTHRRRRPVR